MQIVITTTEVIRINYPANVFVSTFKNKFCNSDQNSLCSFSDGCHFLGHKVLTKENLFKNAML